MGPLTEAVCQAAQWLKSNNRDCPKRGESNAPTAELASIQSKKR